jgi:hypothetical protein
MPTADGYRALVEQAKIEIKPKIMNYLSKRWPKSAIENLSFFAMAVAVYARSISEPPCSIDVGRILLRTVAFCNLRCERYKKARGGCLAAMSNGKHGLPKCIKLPRDVNIIWGYVKIYIATGGAICAPGTLGAQEAMSVNVYPASDFSPSTSC